MINTRYNFFGLNKEKNFGEYSHALISNLNANKMYFAPGKSRNIFQFKNRIVMLKIIKKRHDDLAYLLY